MVVAFAHCMADGFEEMVGPGGVQPAGDLHFKPAGPGHRYDFHGGNGRGVRVSWTG